MKISLGTIEVSDHDRAALAHRYGQTGLASREQVRRFVRDNGLSALDDVRRDYDESEALLARITNAR